jgi:hypothetical protein
VGVARFLIVAAVRQDDLAGADRVDAAMPRGRSEGERISVFGIVEYAFQWRVEDCGNSECGFQ